ncbi:MAG: amidohydrolase family protein [Fluviicola sp.]|nr:amidohydrolase family protein [Fluviicola sp.]
MRRLVFVFLLCNIFNLFGQLNTPVNGVAETPANSFVLTNVTIVVSPEKTIDRGNIIVRDGVIVAVGQQLVLPNDLPIIDGNEKVVLPSFIELFSTIGIPNASNNHNNNSPQFLSKKNGPYYWNEAIHPEVDPTSWYTIDENAINELHKMGFGAALTHQNDGIFQGVGSFVSLGKNKLKQQLIQPKVAAFYSFEKGVSQQEYPSSLMGSIALIRQTLYDADWYKNAQQAPRNYSLDAVIAHQQLPSIFYTNATYEIFRVHALEREFNRKFTVVGTGHEYELGTPWDSLQQALIIPINFPAPYDLKDPYIARQVPFADLKHWELAPTNPAYLSQQKVTFSITTNGLKTADEFWKNLHKSFEFGFTPEEALRALTINPAKLIGVDSLLGTIEKGKKACFTLYDVNPFLYQAKVLEVYTNGEREVKMSIPDVDIRGKYSLNIDGVKYNLSIAGSQQKPEATVLLTRTINDSITHKTKADTLKTTAFIQLIDNDLTLQFLLKDKKTTQHFALKGVYNARVWIVEGAGTDSIGNWVKWSAMRTEKFASKTEEPVWKRRVSQPVQPLYPNMAFGFTEIPKQETIVIENATVWTNESEGIIANATVIVQNGKIKSIQKNTGNYPANARIIDAKGQYLTSGIIDEHSHIAISKGVNESGQAITAEVRIGDVITADDINVYRQLSGGVTAAQLLHGSANPVGGQSALIKLKWGHMPQDYLIPNAPKFVKFALGENVKQANWGDYNSTRFPQTRMGVEQVYIDGFARALAYHEAQLNYQKMSEREKSKSVKPGIDLELEALYEIVTGNRKISCHSYVQSEINMLMHVADSFGFQVNTFTHILEGYKIADKMKAHGVGASTFADWWAYKFEVKDAIPFNAALMQQMNIVVAINSDDAEMGRRLNQEAAKIVKYGGISEEEAWKMVTLNPAKLLHLDDRMGSIKVGKDADLVLWSANPLSIEAKVVYTIVDGEVLYDSQLNEEKQAFIGQEQARIATLMLDSSVKGEAATPFKRRKRGQYHCNTIGQEQVTGSNEH